MQTIQVLMFLEAVGFVAAALTHFGALIEGYEHLKAGTAESVIAAVLLIGLALTWIAPQSIRKIGLAAQAFALFGTLVGIFTITIGVGPRTVPDIVYHVVIVPLLMGGLIVAGRARPNHAGKWA